MMAELMGYESRKQFLQKVVKLIPKEASTVLDIGCGVGLVGSLIVEQIPKASIVGMDMSWHMLTHQVSSPNMTSSSLVQARAPKLPFKKNSFDAVVAVQFLSEVFCFSGTEGFLDTIKQVKRVLKEGGVLVVLDHQNPGEGSIELKLPQDMIEKLRLFQTLFQVRNIAFEALPNSWTRITLRDLYDFLTKVWSFGTALEEEEMQESHTPFTGEEFSNLLIQNGFSVNCVDGVVEFENYLGRYNIDIQQTASLPNRYLIVSAFYKE
ncbi:MAG: class I SAM-dependent methyltransferase [Candidatus Hodarchaeota archaeon]